jgi:hypothetical protein
LGSVKPVLFPSDVTKTLMGCGFCAKEGKTPMVKARIASRNLLMASLYLLSRDVLLAVDN